MSRTGRRHDKATGEACFRPPKHEWTGHRTFASLEEARRSVFRCIETFDHPVASPVGAAVCRPGPSRRNPLWRETFGRAGGVGGSPSPNTVSTWTSYPR